MTETNKFNVGDKVILTSEALVEEHDCEHCGNGVVQKWETFETKHMVIGVSAQYLANAPTVYTYRLTGLPYSYMEYGLRKDEDDN